MGSRIIVGDCRIELSKLDDDSVDCVVTSPPYLGLRKYGGAGAEIGKESTIEEYVETLVQVFADIKRVLKPSGVAWLNIGDGYSCGGRGASSPESKQSRNRGSLAFGEKEEAGKRSGLQFKQLLLIPERMAIALQADGWWIRQRVIWYKPNAMPESVMDRDGCAHEHIWMLTKTAKYYYDVKDGTGLARRRNVWAMCTAGSKDSHFAQFPVELPAQCILSSCPPGGVVLDPFGGAGTTAVAAAKLGRQYILIELNADYVRIAEERLKAIPLPLF